MFAPFRLSVGRLMAQVSGPRGVAIGGSGERDERTRGLLPV